MPHGPVHVDAQKLSKSLGRHTKLGIKFSWSKGGSLVDLSGFTVRVWVTLPDESVLQGSPFNATVDGPEATYSMSAADLADASLSANENVKIVAVAENGTQTLVSDAREISVGDWGGADSYTPV